MEIKILLIILIIIVIIAFILFYLGYVNNLGKCLNLINQNKNNNNKMVFYDENNNLIDNQNLEKTEQELAEKVLYLFKNKAILIELKNNTSFVQKQGQNIIKNLEGAIDCYLRDCHLKI